MVPKLFVLETSPICDICRNFEINWTSNAPSASSYICEGWKHLLLETESRLSWKLCRDWVGNWIESFRQQWANIHFQFYFLHTDFFWFRFVFVFLWRKILFFHSFDLFSLLFFLLIVDWQLWAILSCSIRKPKLCK